MLLKILLGFRAIVLGRRLLHCIMLHYVVSQSILDGSKSFYALVREALLSSALSIVLTLQDVPGAFLSMMTLLFPWSLGR